MATFRSLSIIMPCYNDAGTIGQAIEEAHKVASKVTNDFEILVVNDKSKDETGLMLSKLEKKYPQLRVYTHPINLGYGATIRELYYIAKKDWLFSVPGDYQIGASELMKLIPAKDTADMIIGWRTKRQDPVERLRQSKIYNFLLRFFYRLDLHDVNSVRLMPTHILRNIRLEFTSAFVDAELAIRLKKQGFVIAEVPISHRMDLKKPNGKGGGGGKLKTILPTIRDMTWFWLTN